MSEGKKNANIRTMGASRDAPTRVTIGLASKNAPVRQLNGSQDAPNISSKGKQVSSNITAKD